MVNFIELEGLDDEDILLLETIAERLRKRAKAKRTPGKKGQKTTCRYPKMSLRLLLGPGKIVLTVKISSGGFMRIGSSHPDLKSDYESRLSCGHRLDYRSPG